jgi:hypothetical protein
VIDEINRAKPSSAKGRYILSATLTTTMGPGIRVDTSKAKGADGSAASSTSAGSGSEAEEAPSSADDSAASDDAGRDTAEEPATA